MCLESHEEDLTDQSRELQGSVIFSTITGICGRPVLQSVLMGAMDSATEILNRG